MQPQDYAGRIHKNTFIISTSILLALLLLAVVVRFIIRFRVQKQHFFSDDGFLLVALSGLIVAIVIMYREVIDRMYLVVSLQTGVKGVIPPDNWLEVSHQFHKWVTVCLMLSWCVVMAVKFSFLFFFKRLIDRIQSLCIYWWAVTIYNIGVLGYGVSVYYIGCPYYFDIRELQCASGQYKQLLFNHSTAQMILDLAGDVMILAIPICVIWRLRVQWSQKIALIFSLCLTVFMMVVTIVRVAGLVYHGMVDTIWEIYWMLVSGEVGVFMAAATAFRSFFVARNESRNYNSPHRVKLFFSDSFVKKFTRKRTETLDSLDCDTEPGLPGVPRAHMTGMRTFIDEQGRTKMSQMGSVSERSIKEDMELQEDRDTVPLHVHQR
ncbi:hypothetical protein GQ44DRAFT_664913 [Phaeosphaeriaceae sp. PMI808]|nr:hypothetical protein GQ44DRAFT_664913 [Phaeosphaeriaceae sp. PMI808]